jgi:hypothetical protein
MSRSKSIIRARLRRDLEVLHLRLELEQVLPIQRS